MLLTPWFTNTIIIILFFFGLNYRDNCRAKHDENCRELESTVRRLLQASLRKTEGGFNFRCEARLGKVAWRTSEYDLDGQFCISDITECDKEFYTRYIEPMH